VKINKQNKNGNEISIIYGKDDSTEAAKRFAEEALSFA